mmetsp:Transcript_5587/g.7198  ORF Transcript_5587/g.7198 Transcript_5587/m.7198 type:complete len:323 (+) Transcript_5587:58-1026(+)
MRTAVKPPRPQLILLLISILFGTAVWLWKSEVPRSDAATLEYVGGGQVRTSILFIARFFTFLFFLHRIVMVTIVRSTKIQLSYLPQTQFQLKRRTIELAGPRRFVTFTLWTWTIQCLYFFLASIASWQRLRQKSGRGLPLRLTHVLFQVAWTASHLVTTITSFILIPTFFKNIQATTVLPAIMETDQLVLHNANVAFANLDAILGNMRLISAHMPAAGLYCCIYVLFIWIYGTFAGFVPYFFLDFSLPPRKVIIQHLGLLLLLCGFFQAGTFLTYTATWARLSTRMHPYSLASLFWFRAAVHTALVLTITCIQPPRRFRHPS